ncbi:uncharacterized protein LOC114329483 [Diabrotica virgifera virgifera]|uniref:Uncharacterized protein LOC114329483 n=1 Tax=Diabrotica virgifera virgifera TaxID=50390 RepID=A0A6P7FN29_DIAVI|nr:uncharacterized protein LOC114329483 [Diabrotica virgifera virgifera]
MAVPQRCVRFVNLTKGTTPRELIQHIETDISLKDKIEKVHMGMDYRLQLVFAYVIFKCHEGASRVVGNLNKTTWNDLSLNVETIGPDLEYTVYHTKAIPQPQESSEIKRPKVKLNPKTSVKKRQDKTKTSKVIEKST